MSGAGGASQRDGLWTMVPMCCALKVRERVGGDGGGDGGGGGGGGGADVLCLEGG